MLITGHADPVEEARREDLHVAREHDEVDVAGEQLELPLLGLRLRLARHRDVVVRHAERLARRARDPDGSRRRRRRPSAARRGASARAGRAGSGRSARRRARRACGVARELSRHSISSSAAIAASRASSAARLPARSSRWNSIRRKKLPPSGSVECWSELTMFAPSLGEAAPRAPRRCRAGRGTRRSRPCDVGVPHAARARPCGRGRGRCSPTRSSAASALSFTTTGPSSRDSSSP